MIGIICLLLGYPYRLLLRLHRLRPGRSRPRGAPVFIGFCSLLFSPGRRAALHGALRRRHRREEQDRHRRRGRGRGAARPRRGWPGRRRRLVGKAAALARPSRVKRLLLALILASPLAFVQLAAGCSQQGEGHGSMLNNISDDCATGLSCTAVSGRLGALLREQHQDPKPASARWCRPRRPRRGVSSTTAASLQRRDGRDDRQRRRHGHGRRDRHRRHHGRRRRRRLSAGRRMSSGVTVRPAVLSRFALDGGAGATGSCRACSGARPPGGRPAPYLPGGAGAGGRSRPERQPHPHRARAWAGGVDGEGAPGHYGPGVRPEAPEALRAAGVDPDTVTHVVLTHLHWDHAGAWCEDGALALPAGGARPRRGVPGARAGAGGEGCRGASARRMRRLLLREGRVRRWREGEALAPGMTAWLSHGHTEGLVIPMVPERDDGRCWRCRRI